MLLAGEVVGIVGGARQHTISEGAATLRRKTRGASAVLVLLALAWAGYHLTFQS